MSSENSLIDKKERGTRILPLFGLTLKQSWTTSFLIAIIYFFVFPVPLMVTISGMKKRGIDTAKQFSEAAEWLGIIRYLIVPLTAVLGVVLTCVMLRYLKNKVAVDFYHSLPISRVKLYFVRELTGYLAVILPLAVMLIVGGVIFAANDLMCASIIESLFGIFFESVIYSLLYYGFATLIGMLSGVTGVHLVLSGIAVFIVPAIYMLNVLFFYSFDSTMWADWYFLSDKLALLSPVLAFFINEKTSLVYALILVLAAAGLLIAGCFVYKKRKSERAGESIVFAPIRSVVKYIMVYTMTLASGLLFYYITENRVWMVFGFVSGAVLTFLLANTIIYKSAKAMLTGLKGFLVYSVCAALCIGGIMIDPLGAVASLPDAENVSHVTLRLGDNTGNFVYSEKDTIASALAICEKANSIDKVPTLSYQNIYINAVIYPKFGLPVTKEFTLWVSEDTSEQLRVLLDSAEFREQYLDMISTGYLRRMTFPYTDSTDFILSSIHKGGETERETFNELHEAMLLDFAEVGCGFFNSEAKIGNFSLYDCSDSVFGRHSVELPLYASMKNTEKVLLKHGLISESLGSHMKKLNDGIDIITVRDVKTGETKTYTEKEQIQAISDAAAVPLNRGSDDYFHVFTCDLTMSDLDYVIVMDIYGSELTVYFIKGRVPSFVIDDLSQANRE